MPVGLALVALGLEHLALGDALLARCGAHRVGGLEHAQRLRAGNQVGRTKRPGLELGGQLLRLEFHAQRGVGGLVSLASGASAVAGTAAAGDSAGTTTAP